MTTRLSGDSTRFLPFNRGNGDRAGNPQRDGYRTGYLWEEVWSRDAWLDLLDQFVLTTTDDKGKKVTLFPRYHQWQRGARARRPRPRARRRALVPRAALGRLGQVEHDRLARPPALSRCTTPTTARCSTRSS